MTSIVICVCIVSTMLANITVSQNSTGRKMGYQSIHNVYAIHANISMLVIVVLVICHINSSVSLYCYLYFVCEDLSKKESYEGMNSLWYAVREIRAN